METTLNSWANFHVYVSEAIIMYFRMLQNILHFSPVAPIVSLTIVFGVKIRNGIPQILKKKKRPKKACKRSLIGTLLDVLQTEDSNIDVDMVIVKMKSK